MKKEFKNFKEQIVGELVGKTYISKRTNEHFMRIYQGFGISDSIIYELRSLGCDTVRIIYFGKKKIVYETSLDNFVKSTKTHDFEGKDLQHFVSVRDMNVLKEFD